MVDYAIARRIVDLHSRMDESVERVYSVEDITRYIMFARQFKPKVSLEMTYKQGGYGVNMCVTINHINIKVYSVEDITRYIMFARQFKPV